MVVDGLIAVYSPNGPEEKNLLDIQQVTGGTWRVSRDDPGFPETPRSGDVACQSNKSKLSTPGYSAAEKRTYTAT